MYDNLCSECGLPSTTGYPTNPVTYLCPDCTKAAKWDEIAKHLESAYAVQDSDADLLGKGGFAFELHRLIETAKIQAKLNRKLADVRKR